MNLRDQFNDECLRIIRREIAIRKRKRELSNFRLQYIIACSLHVNFYARNDRKHEMMKTK